MLRTLVPLDKQIEAKDGRWFKVRIMPYRTLDNRIDGVVITLADITIAKTLEAELRTKQGELKTRVDEQSKQLLKQKKGTRS